MAGQSARSSFTLRSGTCTTCHASKTGSAPVFVAFRFNVDAINETVRTLSRAIPDDSVIQMVCDAAEAIDSKVATMPTELASAIEAGGYTRILHRALHRSEHLDQIEEAMKP